MTVFTGKKIQVYVFNEEGKFLWDDLIMEEYDDNNVLVIPPGCTNIAPPNLATEPRFKDGAWHPTKEYIPPEPTPPLAPRDEVFEARISALEKANEELTLKVSNLDRTVSQMSSDLQNTRYYLQIAFPHVKHYFGG